MECIQTLIGLSPSAESAEFELLQPTMKQMMLSPLRHSLVLKLQNWSCDPAPLSQPLEGLGFKIIRSATDGYRPLHGLELEQAS